jgi:hypothetical protein
MEKANSAVDPDFSGTEENSSGLVNKWAISVWFEEYYM